MRCPEYQLSLLETKNLTTDNNLWLRALYPVKNQASLSKEYLRKFSVTLLRSTTNDDEIHCLAKCLSYASQHMLRRAPITNFFWHINFPDTLSILQWKEKVCLKLSLKFVSVIAVIRLCDVIETIITVATRKLNFSECFNWRTT